MDAETADPREWFKEAFATKLKTLRDRAGVSQETMARELGINPQTIVNYEGRKSIPDAYMLRQIGTYLRADFNVLIDPAIQEPKQVEPPFSSAVKLLQAASDLGVVGIYRNRAAAMDAFRTELAIECEEVFIVGSSIKGLTEPLPNFFELLGGCKKRNPNALIRIVLTSPYLSFLRESIEGRPGDAILREIREAWEKLTSEKYENRLPFDSVRFFPGTPTVFLFGTSKRILLNPYSWGDVAYRTFTIEVEKDPRHTECIYEVYRSQHFLKTWEKAISAEDFFGNKWYEEWERECGEEWKNKWPEEKRTVKEVIERWVSDGRDKVIPALLRGKRQSSSPS